MFSLSDPFLQEVFSSLGITPEEKKAMSEEEQEEMYGSAYDYYSIGRYSEAECLFVQLLLSHPYEPRFWRGLASSRQMQQRFKEALHAWCLVALLEETDAFAHYHAAECMASLGEKEEAMKALAMAESLAGQDKALQIKIDALRKSAGGFYAP
jgi:type III secretion system low calcium response chaperone LcrH/SycD